MAEIRRQVIRLAREFPQVCLVVGGIPEVYRLFDSLPESRRVFLPPVGADLHPALLAEMDILLVPLRDTPSNRMLSDRPL
ncbi:MAG: hypothetical protein HY260_22860, partial [Chloroflexi bacterium]|nr:hypothetical protein [Chloroflexota bacterium]